MSTAHVLVAIGIALLIVVIHFGYEFRIFASHKKDVIDIIGRMRQAGMYSLEDGLCSSRLVEEVNAMKRPDEDKVSVRHVRKILAQLESEGVLYWDAEIRQYRIVEYQDP